MLEPTASAGFFERLLQAGGKTPFVLDAATFTGLRSHPTIFEVYSGDVGVTPHAVPRALWDRQLAVISSRSGAAYLVQQHVLIAAEDAARIRKSHSSTTGF